MSTSLDAQALERKARLAKLKSLKRSRATDEDDQTNEDGSKSQSAEPSITDKFLSGRNYDAETRGAKLGFEKAPTADQETLEDKAAAISLETAKAQAEEEKADKPIDLFKLQPKKPNWDLKRDMEAKLARLNVRTDNAIAKMVKQRITEQQATAKGGANGAENGSLDGDKIGMEGSSLLEGVHQREKEELEEDRREKEDEEMT